MCFRNICSIFLSIILVFTVFTGCSKESSSDAAASQSVTPVSSSSSPVSASPSATPVPDKLSYRIPDGMVAVAVRISDMEGVSGYLSEGDVVNILADKKAIAAAIDGTTNYKNSYYEPVNQEYLVKNVTVIAKGENAYVGPAAQTESGTPIVYNSTTYSVQITPTPDPVESPSAESSVCVILCVDEYAAKLIAEVVKTSKLTFALLGHTDTVTVPVVPGISGDFTYEVPYMYVYVVATPTPAPIPSIPMESIIYG